jgi:hypothetical protein
MVVPVRASNTASGSRRLTCRKSVGDQNRAVPQRACCLPAVTNTVRAMSNRSHI